MDFNSLIFPIPPPSYDKTSYPGHLIWIPKKDFAYKDKLKYSVKCNQKDSEQKFLSNLCERYGYSKNGKLIFHNKSVSMIQRVPSVSFEIDNKFSEVKRSAKMSYIPCLFIKPPSPSDKLFLYFHSNYEDLGNTFSFCSYLSANLNVNILSVEYPGYGIYKCDQPTSEDLIIEDAKLIFKFLNEVEQIKEENIVIVGRCVGSGPAVFLATQHDVLSLILISPFKSIKEAVRTMFPKFNFGNFLKNFVRERFNNLENISKVASPILFVHGKNDTVIPPVHSEDLMKQCKSPTNVVFPLQMTHNSFDFYFDIVVNIRDFLKVFTVTNEFDQNNIKKKVPENDTDEHIQEHQPLIDFPKIMFKCPVGM